MIFSGISTSAGREEVMGVTVRARDIMSRPVITVDADAPLRDCMALMAEHRVSGVPVVEAGRAVGIITEADIVRRIRPEIPWYTYLADGTWFLLPLDADPTANGNERLQELAEQPVRRFMTPRLIHVKPEDDLREVARVLTDHRVKRVAVIDGGRLIGIISRGDVVRGLLQATSAPGS